MNGELAQLIWLASHGSRCLASGKPLPESPTVFQYVSAVRFDAPRRRRLRAVEPTDDPNAWLTQLARSGIDRVGLDALGQLDRSDPGPLPDHAAVAFVGGHGASLVAVGERRAERWIAQWTVPEGEQPPDNRIWYVHYVGQVDDRGAALEHPTLDTAMPLLTKSIEKALGFSTAQELSTWSGVFDEALRFAADEQAEIPYHPDLLPPETDSLRRRLMAAACKAYVFGGMGSWNDISFDDDAGAEYDAVTRSLYQAVMTAVDAVANNVE